jgi:hypothetical protein
MTPKPFSGKDRHFIQRARLFEEMAGAGDDRELALGFRRQLGSGSAVQIQNHWVLPAHDE